MTTTFHRHWRDVPKNAWRWPNFSPAEIACRGTGKLLINEPALDKLQALRDRLGKPLIVRSAYRSPEHNRAVGGATRSKHLDGAAFDRMLQRMATSARRAVDHRPRTYDGDAMLVVAAAGEADPDTTAGRWTPFLGGRITRVDVDADHLGIVGTVALEVIGPRIDAAIREAESRGDNA